MRFTSWSVAAASAILLAACAEESTSPATPEQSPTVAFASEQGELQRADAKSNRQEPAGVDRGRFNITLKYVVPVTDRQREVFEAAAARWERIIIADVPSITGTIPSAFLGLPPASVGVLDDIVIEVALTPIDGPGRVLGSAGPRFIRTVDALPVSGLMRFDTADLQLLEDRGLFEDVIVHEMGHVLGVGTIWNFRRSLRQGPTTNPFFTGKFANVHWGAEGGTDLLPIENIGGPGTAGGHWRESILRNELMTGFLNLGENPLSRITASSMRDLGYGVGVVGERYALVKGAPGVVPAVTASAEGLNIAEMEELLEPIGYVEEDVN